MREMRYTLPRNIPGAGSAREVATVKVRRTTDDSAPVAVRTTCLEGTTHAGLLKGAVWCTIATEGWDDKKIRAERFQRIGSSNVPALCGLRASVKLASDIGIDRIERRHRYLADYMLDEMKKRGAESWTSPDPALRCGIVSVNVPPVPRQDLENWLWKTQKIRIRGGDPYKLRLSTPYYLQKKDIDRFLEKFDEYKREKKLA